MGLTDGGFQACHREAKQVTNRSMPVAVTARPDTSEAMWNQVGAEASVNHHESWSSLD